ncbi:MAG: hypothetical protein FJW38_31225, partial [Acidobacteria bacterium]|nr:hypothetical protein [Acidobacteriota bacterium]
MPHRVIITLITFVTATLLPAATLHVANNGTDSPECGPINACRSIRQAIANAQVGADIVVGPGRYGDVNGNGVFGESGEEGYGPRDPCNCLIQVGKKVFIRSSKGARVTLIEGSPASRTFWVTATGAAIGAGSVAAATDSGFLLTNANTGVESTANSTTIQRNIAVKNNVGFKIGGSSVTIRENEARVNSDSGFVITSGSGRTVESNTATGNGAAGFSVSGDADTYEMNVSSANRWGFDVYATNSLFEHSSAVANLNFGVAFKTGASGNKLRLSGVVGNGGYGVWIWQNAVSEVTTNWIYGNQHPRPGSEPAGGNCGLLNSSNAQVDARYYN